MSAISDYREIIAGENLRDSCLRVCYEERKGWVLDELEGGDEASIADVGRERILLLPGEDPSDINYREISGLYEGTLNGGACGRLTLLIDLHATEECHSEQGTFRIISDMIYGFQRHGIQCLCNVYGALESMFRVLVLAKTVVHYLGLIDTEELHSSVRSAHNQVF